MKTLRFLRWGDKRDAVLHCPSVVGGNATTLSRHLNMAGCPSICVAYESHPFGYQAEVTLWRDNMSLFRKELVRLMAVLRAALGYQVIHFNFGTSMANPSLPPGQVTTSRADHLLRRIHATYSEGVQVLELFLLRALRRQVFVTFQGDDARQGDLSRQLFDESIAHHTDERYYNPLSDRAKRRRIKRLHKVASQVFYLNPDLAHFLPADSVFVPYCHTEVKSVERRRPRSSSQTVRFLHAPSHRGAKGTDCIIRTFRQLKNDGLPIDLILIEGMPQSQVWQAINECDVLVDQLYAGWYGGIAVEALCRGVPVMAFIRELDLSVVKSEMVEDLPVINVNTDSLLKEVTRFLSLTPNEKDALSLSGIKYAEKWHSPESIAQLFSTLYGVRT